MNLTVPQSISSRLIAGFLALGPARTAFLGSLLLSLIALQRGTLNRDGMWYVETARVFLGDGLAAALAHFNWPFFSILIGGLARMGGFEAETAGYVLTVLFMAGTCALLVDSAARAFPGATWYVVLVVLAMPGLNGYRDELLREYGCWFFVMLSVWLAIRWSDAPNWPMALAAQFALLLGTLFRPEALALIPAFLFWQWFGFPDGQRWYRVAMLGLLPVVTATLLVAMLALDHLRYVRLAADFDRLALAGFGNHTAVLAGVLPEHARDNAATILFFGSLAIIPLKFFAKMGPFVAPFLYAFMGQGVRPLRGCCAVFAWLFLAHALVLCLFVLEMQFLAGRYVGPLLLFAVPFAGFGLWRMVERFPRWKPFVLALAVLIMASNVISLSPTKQHFVEAGQWLAGNAEDTPRVYIESVRTAYYAGWRIRPRLVPQDRQNIEAGLREGKYDIIVLEVSRKEPDISPWLAAMGLVRVIDFIHANGDAVIIAKPVVVPKTP